MEFKHLAISLSLLFSLALGGESQGRTWLPEEEYWEAVWPNTPIPTVLRELLKPGLKRVEIDDDHPMEAVDDTQYPGVFFNEHDLYPSKIMNVPFSPFAEPHAVLFLYWGWDDEIKDFDKERYTFNVVCVLKGPVKGENKYCAKSLETVMGFAISKLGKNIEPLSSSFTNKKEQYTIDSIQNLGDKAVMCHRLNFGRVVFYCHQHDKTTSFMVSLVAANGTKTHAIAVCHKDISGMINPEILRKVLKLDPTSNSICHFIENNAIVWVPKLAINNAYNDNAAV